MNYLVYTVHVQVRVQSIYVHCAYVCVARRTRGSTRRRSFWRSSTCTRWTSCTATSSPRTSSSTRADTSRCLVSSRLILPHCTSSAGPAPALPCACSLLLCPGTCRLSLPSRPPVLCTAHSSNSRRFATVFRSACVTLLCSRVYFTAPLSPQSLPLALTLALALLFFSPLVSSLRSGCARDTRYGIRYFMLVD